MRKTLSFAITIMLLAGLTFTSFSAYEPDLGAVISGAADYILKTVQNPQVGNAGGEWAILGLARSGYEVPDIYYENYYRNVEEYLRESGGVLSAVRYTEYSRIILSLTAAGYDPCSIEGYDLTEALEDTESVSRQGVNSLIYALLALDSQNYPSGKREYFVSEILNRQLDDGGWNLAGGLSGNTNNPADPDVTGMALQALAKYQYDSGVKAATELALARLSKMQRDNGGFIGWEDVNLESTVQVLVALCELGIPVDDPRFVKNGVTLVDNILSYMNPDFSFKHTYDSGGNSQMSSEQALYSLVAVQRAVEGKNSLYRMSDAARREGSPVDDPYPAAGAGLPGKNPDVSAMPVLYSGKTFSDIANHKSRTEIEALAVRGIISGKDEHIFDPDATMTRAEFAAITVRGLGLLSNTKTSSMLSKFDDVAESDWYYPYVCLAVSYDIVRGVSENRFEPDNVITRQEAAVMAARAAKLCGMDTSRGETEIRNTLAQFGDYRTAEDWALESLAFCYDSGILDASPFNIKPREPVLRCEVAEMLHMTLQKANLIY